MFVVLLQIIQAAMAIRTVPAFDFDKPLSSITTLPQITTPFPSCPIYKPSLLYLGFLTLPFSLHFFSSLFPPSLHPPSFPLSPLLYMLVVCPYSCYIGLHCTRSTSTGFATLATPRFRYRCSAMLTLKMKKTAVTLSYVHTNIRKIWQTSDVSNDGFKPCRC